MSKKRTKASKKKKGPKRVYSTKNLNDQLMPIANDIKSKMEMLEQDYKFNLDFAFKEITMDEIFNNSEF